MNHKTACLTLSVFFIAVLLVSFVGATSYIGDSGTIMYHQKYSIYPYSYMIEPFNSTFYQSINASGYVYQSTNASKVYNFVAGNLTNGEKVHIRNGTYNVDNPAIITANYTIWDGEGWNTKINISGIGGFLLSNANYEQRNVEFRDLCFDGNGIALFGINTTCATTSRIRFLTVYNCRFQNFHATGAIAINITNPELCYMQKCNFAYTNKACIRLASTTYNAGNVWVEQNFIYVGSSVGNGTGLYIENCDSTHATEIGSIWSRDNQYYSDPSLDKDSIAIYLNATSAGIRQVRSEGDRFERIQAFHANTPSSYTISDCEVCDGHMFDSYGNHKLFFLGDDTYRNAITDNVINSGNATGIVLDDVSTESTLGKQNSFTNNQVYGTAGYTFAGCKYTLMINNVNVNPFSKKTTLFIQGSYLTYWGTATAFSNNTQYYMRTSNCLVTTTGGADLNFTILDPSGNQLITGLTSLTNELIPFGYSVIGYGSTWITGIAFYWL
jgi:hypothetical protein